jgi:predicted nuclease with RNAse H fold
MSGAPVYIGIDPTAGVRPMTLAALDSDLRILKLEDGPLDDLLQIVQQYPRCVCAVDAPIDHSHNLLSDQAYRERLGLKPGISYTGYRICEYELRRRGIHIYKTPPDRSQAATWMREGWRLYDRLREIGFVAYPQAGPRRMFETYPHAIYTMLIKKRPYRKTTLEGRLQRQLVLFEQGMGVPDAMDSLEEMTRHRLLVGELDLKGLQAEDELDALASAYTAFALDREPHNVSAIGDPSEGQILIPVPVHELKELYT